MDEELLELVDDHAVVVEVDLEVAGLVRAERRERADVGGRLHDDLVARVEEDLRDQVQGLLRAGRDHEVLGVGLDAFRSHQADEALPELQQALPSAVLERLGPTLGLKKLGCSVTEVAPGRTAYPFHSHRVNDELFFVLAGGGELRLGDERHPVQAGDLIGCPAGDPASAHQLINTGREPLRYLAISSQLDPEICEYPDSGKVGVYAGDDENGGLVHLTRYADQVDYWQGE